MSSSQSDQERKSPTREHPVFNNVQHFLSDYQPKGSNYKKQQLTPDTIAKIQGTSGTYYGRLQSRKKNGFGVFISKHGSIYEGFWKDGVKHGEGYLLQTDGSSYSGNFNNDKPEGLGKHKMKGGDFYEGEWRDGKRNGSGVWKGVHGQSYIGQWIEGEPEGFGILTDKEKNKYEGFVKKGKKHGKGIEKMKNGSIYEGNYEDGVFHGYGELYFQNGSIYKGEFVKGTRQGPGTWMNSKDSSKYEGYFRNNKKQGYGIFIWNTGGIYKGNFQDDLRSGFGEMFWPNGDIYRGRWKNGKQNGKGELIVRDEGQYTGIFRNNELVVLINEQEKLKEVVEEEDSRQGSLENIKVKTKEPEQKAENNFQMRKKKNRAWNEQITSYANLLLPILRPNYSRKRTETKLRQSKVNSILPQTTKNRKPHSSLAIHQSFGHEGRSSPANDKFRIRKEIKNRYQPQIKRFYTQKSTK